MKAGTGVVEENAFSVSAAKAMFEAAKRPEVQKAAMAAAKNPFIRKTAMNAAKDPGTRSTMMNVLASSDAGSKPVPPPKKFDEAPPPPPPHKSTTPRPPSAPKPDYSFDPSPPPPLPPAAHRTYTSGATSSSSYSSQAPTPQNKLNVNPSFLAELQGLQVNKSSASAAAKPSRPPPPQSTAATAATVAGNNNHLHKLPLPAPVQYRSSSTTEPHAIVKYPFNGAQFDELSCDVGDVIILKREVDEQWIYGMNSRSGANGIVPLDFLDVRIPLAPSQPGYQSGTSNSHIGTAIYDYNSPTQGDLQFRCNDRINLIEFVNNDWLFGELRGQKGIFPANFITCPSLSSLPFRSTAQIQTPPNNTPITTMYAAFDYYSGVSDDLQLKAGDSVEILEYLGTDWVRGRSSGQSGMAPLTFLTSSFSPKKSPSGLESIKSIANVRTMATAIEDHETTDSSNLYCTKGARLIIVEDCDEFLYRAKLEEFKSLPSGLIPKRKVVLDD